MQIGSRAEVSEVNDTSQYGSICVMASAVVTPTKMADLSSLCILAFLRNRTVFTEDATQTNIADMTE